MDAERGAVLAEREHRFPFAAALDDVFSGLVAQDARLTSAPRVVVVTRIDAWRGHFGRLQSLVAPALRMRAERLRDVDQRERRLLAYALHRLVVARVLGRDPERVEIGRMASGMPMVAGLPNIATSLSHADDLVAFAVSRDAGLIGVDIETDARARLLDGLTDTVLHPQEQCGDEQLIAAWVRKEAVLKAIGSGLAVDMATFRSGQGDAVAGLVMATGLRAWALPDWIERAWVGLCAPAVDGLLARIEPDNVDAVSLREQINPMCDLTAKCFREQYHRVGKAP